MTEYIVHPFEPFFRADSKILIVGSLPSVKSRENGFYYGHPQNRFWKVIAGLTESEVPQTIEEKKKLLLEHGIAIWDVIESCDIIGSSDSSIKNVVPADIKRVVANSKIQNIYANGGTAKKLYEKYIYPVNGIKAHKLPSTSPANAGYSLDRLKEAWAEIKE